MEQGPLCILSQMTLIMRKSRPSGRTAKVSSHRCVLECYL